MDYVKASLRDKILITQYNIGEVIDMRDIGKNIKDLRQRQNMTQEELADKLFVTRQTVSNYETGKSRPDVDMIIKIAEVLSTDANTVFYGITTPPDKRKAYRRLIIGASILVMLLVIYMGVVPIAEKWRYYYLQTSLWAILIFCVRPLMLLLFGWCLFHGLSLALHFKELSGKRIQYCKWVLISTAALLFISKLPWMVFIIYGDYLAATTGSVMLTFPSIPVLRELMWFAMIIDVKAPAVYALVGGGLRLFHFPK